jgi:hypothetical protein
MEVGEEVLARLFVGLRGFPVLLEGLFVEVV